MTSFAEKTESPRRLGALLLCLPLAVAAASARPASGAAPGRPAPAEPAGARFARLPLHFEPNRGQADVSGRYIARGPGYSLHISETSATLAVRRTNLRSLMGAAGKPAPDLAAVGAAGSAVRMTLAGASGGAKVVGERATGGVSHYLRGKDRSKWVRNVPHVRAVRVRQAYPGVDVVYYGQGKQLEYDFIVQPGADPGRIAMQFELLGKDAGQVTPELGGGEMRVRTPEGVLRQLAPVAYQGQGQARRSVSCAYRVEKNGAVRLALGSYDRRRPLVIDPILVYSGYLGGVEDDAVTAVAADAFGNAYFTGVTSSTNFPVLGAIQPTLSNVTDAFVTKVNASGSEVVYSTYLGGDVPEINSITANDIGWGIAVDGAGNAHVVGSTESDDFPTTAGSLQPVPTGGGGDAFVAKLNAAGDDAVCGIRLDAKAFAYVTGSTGSATFPTTVGAYQTAYGGGASDAFLCKINQTGTMLEWSTFLGGGPSIKTDGDDYGLGLALDPTAEHTSVVYVVGTTNAHNFPLGRPLQITPTRFEGFVTKFSDDGSAILYSTFLGGRRDDRVQGVAVDEVGAAYVVGTTASDRFENTPDPVQPYGGGDTDAFIAKLHPKATHLEYFTFYGFKGTDLGTGIVVDANHQAWVTGAVNYPNEATVTAPRVRIGKGDGFFAARKADALVLKLASQAPRRRSDRFFTSYDLSGRNDDQGNAIAMDPHGDIYLGGLTLSTDFPDGAVDTFQPSQAGEVDGFVAKLGLEPYGRIGVSPAALAFSARVGQSIVRTFRVRNVGRRTIGVTVTTPMLPFEVLSGAGSFVLAPGGSRTVEVRFGPTATGFFRERLRIVSTATGRRADILMRLSGRARP